METAAEETPEEGEEGWEQTGRKLDEGEGGSGGNTGKWETR